MATLAEIYQEDLEEAVADGLTVTFSVAGSGSFTGAVTELHARQKMTDSGFIQVNQRRLVCSVAQFSTEPVEEQTVAIGSDSYRIAEIMKGQDTMTRQYTLELLV